MGSITEGFEFLGYRVIRSIGTRGKMVPKVLVPEKAMNRFRIKVREMLAEYYQRDSRSQDTTTQLAHPRVVRIL
jgi:hypothetical protein